MTSDNLQKNILSTSLQRSLGTSKVEATNPAGSVHESASDPSLDSTSSRLRTAVYS